MKDSNLFSRFLNAPLEGEALLGAHFKIYGSLDEVRAIVSEWKDVIDCK